MIIIKRYRQRRPQTQSDQPHPAINQTNSKSDVVGFELKDQSSDNEKDFPLANTTSNQGSDCTELSTNPENEHPQPTFQA